MLDFSIEKNFDLSNINLDFSDDLNKGIDIVALDIQQGIDGGGQFGVSFKPNAESTIKKKRHDQPLIGKKPGLLRNAKKMIKTKANPRNQVATLLPNTKRIDIGFWNDQGTHTIPRRHFWGISEKSDKEITVRMAAKLDKELRDA